MDVHSAPLNIPEMEKSQPEMKTKPKMIFLGSVLTHAELALEGYHKPVVNQAEKPQLGV